MTLKISEHLLKTFQEQKVTKLSWTLSAITSFRNWKEKNCGGVHFSKCYQLSNHKITISSILVNDDDRQENFINSYPICNTSEGIIQRNVFQSDTEIGIMWNRFYKMTYNIRNKKSSKLLNYINNNKFVR